jgi:hypothetical protein
MKHPVLYHWLVWAIFWGVPMLFNYQPPRDSPDRLSMHLFLAWKNTMVLSSCCTLVSYTNYVALKQVFFKKQYSLYASIVLIAILIGSIVCHYFLPPPPHIRDFLQARHIFANIGAWFISTLLWFAWRGYIKDLEYQEAQTKRVEAEMDLLKMQIHPHFLFNTLNNVYATNLQSPPKANEMILQLADLLRYQLEITKQERIALEEEITLTENYIALEKIRLAKSDVVIEKNGAFEDMRITPLLLLPLVENAFKYSHGTATPYIHIIFLAVGKKFIFTCHNNIAPRPPKQRSYGMGLANVEKRLLLLYKNRHKLHIQKDEQQFMLTLEIDFQL